MATPAAGKKLKRSHLPEFAVRAAAEATDTDIVAVFQDSGKKPTVPKGNYAPWVERLRKSEAFAARLGQTQFVRFGGKGAAENCLFTGVGVPAELTEEKLRQAGGHAWMKLLAEK